MPLLREEILVASRNSPYNVSYFGYNGPKTNKYNVQGTCRLNAIKGILRVTQYILRNILRRNRNLQGQKINTFHNYEICIIII